MSLILKALKKAEEDRKGKKANQSAKFPIWLKLFGAVLFLNTFLLLWIIGIWKKDVLTTSNTIIPRPNNEIVRGNVQNPSALHLANRSILSTPRFVVPPSVVPSTTKPFNEKPEPITVSNESKVNLPTKGNGTPATTQVSANKKDGNRTISRVDKMETLEPQVYPEEQFPQSVGSKIPPMHLSIHYYAKHSRSRMVCINGQILHEGAQMKSGPFVEEISSEGVILRFESNRFLIRKPVPD